MAILGGILESFDGTGDTIIVIPATSAAAYEPLYLLSQIRTVDGSGSDLDADLLDGYHASYFGTAAQVTNLQNTDVSLQSQVNNLFAIGSRLVFRENFTGNGSATGFVLTGALQNAGFSVGSWSAANVLTALQVDITDLDGKPIYDSSIPIYRDRIKVTSVDSFGNVTVNFPPLAGQQLSIWYWYQLQAGNVLSYYYREDHVAEMEGDGVQMASQVDTDTTLWGNIVLRTTDNTVQKALNRLDAYVANLSGGGGSGSGFTPIAGDGITITPVGFDYSFSVNDYIGRTEVASISGDLQSQIDAIVIPDTSNFITTAEVAAISASLQGQINAISVPTSATFLSDYDARYVNVTGDTMTGQLSVPSIKLQDNNLLSSSTSGELFYHLDNTNEKSGLYFNANGDLKQLDFDSNTAGPVEKIVLVNNGDGTINAPSIIVYLYSNSNWSGTYRHYHIPAATNLALTDNTINYLVANYNSGSPVYQITTDPATINNSNIALIATMSRVGNEIHWIPVDWGLATAVKLNNRQINIQRFERSSGLMLSETATRVINISSGVIWYGSSSNPVSSVVSSSNNADFWYHSAGNWTKSIVSTYNNSQYDDGTNLGSLSANDYTVNWVYRYLDGAGLPKIAYVLGSSYSTLAQAQASLSPNIPVVLDRTAILVGRIIVRNGQSTAAQIDSAFATAFAGSVVTDHNNLSGLQGGTTSEYYHLTASQASDFIGSSTVASISGDLQSQINNKVGFTGGLADRVAYWNSSTSISASNLTISEISPKTLTASSETEFLSAVSTLNSRGGGVIILTGQITLTANRTVNLDFIRVIGTAADSNAIYLSPSIGGPQYTLTINGTNFYFDTVRFRGGNAGSSVTARGLTLYSNGIANGVFENCIFRNVLGGFPTTNGFIGLEAAIGSGWNLRFYNCDATSDNNGAMQGMGVNLVSTLGFLNVYLYNNTRAPANDNRSLVTFFGTNPTGGNINITSDGTYNIVINSPLNSANSKSAAYVSGLITSQTEKTSFVTNDLILISDGADSNKIKKLNRSNMGFVNSSDLTNYTLLSTTATISGSLQSQINAITVPTSATFVSDYDARYVNEGDLLSTLGNYTLLSTTASISGGLNTRLTTVEDNYATKASPSAGNYNNVTINSQGIVTSGSNVDYATNTTVANISAALNAEILQASVKTVGFVIDGAGSVPATGPYASIVSPFSGTINSWTIVSDVSGSATLDIWKANGAKPTNANSITASAKPTLTSSDFATSSTLTGWTTSVSTGDVFTVELEAISGCGRITLQLGVTV